MRKALSTVEPAGSDGSAYSTIMQGETQACGTFVDQLTHALEKPCPDEQAHPYLIKSLGFSNANIECKRVILALPNQPPTVPQMLSACNKLHTPQHIVKVQANTLGEQLARSQNSLGDKLRKDLEI